MIELKIGDRIISGIERIDSLSRTEKNLGVAALALSTGIISEINNEGPVFPYLCFVAASCYAGIAARNNSVDHENISNES